ncbi:methyltransferase domain-containing protein [Kiloniella majae]|uniref:methyltransferase domain-containing protein n=1 Tax=Kiloniella majae TaxID=1938558 RepID=UPI000A279406|nr:methyltransferase domain-containing protein [Kiloniella majae]
MNLDKENPISRFNGKESDEYKYFANDFRRERERQWLSVFSQVAPIILLPDVKSVLEFGSGRDISSSLIKHFGITHHSVDVSDRFFPDTVSSIADYPFEGETHDFVCSFQCLEHNPLEEVSALVQHMAQFTNKYLYFSLPYSGGWFSLSLSLRLPKFSLQKSFYKTFDSLGGRRINTEPFYKRPENQRYDPHWWEVGRPGTSKKHIVKMFEDCGLKLNQSHHNSLFPHHIFLLFEKK